MYEILLFASFLLNGSLVSTYSYSVSLFSERGWLVSLSLSRSSTRRLELNAHGKSDGSGSSRDILARETHIPVVSENDDPRDGGSATLQGKKSSRHQESLRVSPTDIGINVSTGSNDLSKVQETTPIVQIQTCVNCSCGKIDGQIKGKNGRNGTGEVGKNIILALILTTITIIQEPNTALGTAQEALDILHGTQPHTDSTIVWFTLFVGYYLAQEQIMKKIASF